MASFPFAGLKKQFNKANQFMTERITGVEGTKLDGDFQDMEKRTDLYNDLVDDLQLKTKEYLQPNPTVRAKMAAVKGISKLSGQAKASTYPQPEGTLGESMTTFGRKLQDFENSNSFAAALIEMGESMKQMADLKYALDDNVKQNFLEPLHHTQTKDLKEVMHHRKKLQGRKLDFDCKKRTGAREDEIKVSEDKFAESLHLAQLGMHNLLDGSGIEQISQLTQFAESMLEYHKNCAEILQNLTEKLYEKTNEASAKPKSDFKLKTLEDLGVERVNDYSMGGVPRPTGPPGSSTLPVNSNMRSTTPGVSTPETPTHHNNGSNRSSPAFGEMAWQPHPTPSPKPSPATTPIHSQQPSCTALFDFDAENPAELSFKEGDTILLKAQIDENWFEGMVHGKTGVFPTNYVNVTIPLPK